MSARNSHDYAGVGVSLAVSRDPADADGVSEQESFDDAPESIENNDTNVAAQPSSTRSLTDSPPVGSISSPDTTEKPPFPSESQDEGSGEEKKVDGADEDTGNGEKQAEEATADEKAGVGKDNDKTDDELHKADNPETKETEQLGQDTAEKSPVHTPRHSLNEVNLNGAVDPTDAEETPRRRTSQKSPLLTSHRLSSTSSLDEVNLANEAANAKDDVSPPVPPKDASSTAPSGFKALSNNLPSLPWGSAAPANKSSPTSAAPPQPTRKLSSGPFAWFSRNSTGSKDIKSPPQNAFSRRNTAASVSTIASNVDSIARHDGEDGDTSSLSSKKTRRNSLKDQFKLLRMREEGIVAQDEEGGLSARASVSQPGASPQIIPEEGEDGILATSVAPVSGATSPGKAPSIVNPDLAPGTVSGVSASATDASMPVDWDLWQQLVNDGPQALAGSEELNKAIKRGIPQTVRGVIWQILADSQQVDGMEEIYRELVARGTNPEKDRRTPPNQLNGSAEKESTSSSRSSIRSEHSGSGTQSTSVTPSATPSAPPSVTPSVTPSPSLEVDPEKLAKEQAASENARIKKAKSEAAALQKLEKAIRRDLGARTSYSRYFVSQGNQESLFGLCKAYALYDEGVGYAQGMNFIVMPLLFNMDEVEAFALLVKLMNNYGLREMFIQDMPGLHRSLYQFERLLEDLEPTLYCHLRRRGVHPQLYATQWFLTLFAYRFPLQLVLRIYDLIFEEGLETTIIKFGVAIMRRNAQQLLIMKDMGPLTTFLKERLFDAYIDKQPSPSSILESGFFGSSGAADKEVYRSDLLVQDACAIPLTPEMMAAYSAEWEEKVRTEKEHEAELETLRHTVSTQGARVRLLEERAEASDKEHVQLASELVRLKVENEELRDLDEALKVQVSELKSVVDKQPAEVEEKLRTEMDRIMKRNIEVQNENRAMEEQMSEMEKELVATKMKWAELCENHDNLKQKWNDLRRALD
ncbi:hypothetical protein N7474_007279 [Penicillium riverlandense]|uniref:uncharacterized protein n=1 Tax=Penicillium riverlandense TaxID=1903569 RepID=UPI002547FBF3|nr:uncharacterized protein N7474_007279 [Penicillium riverlandense]KAJ5815502.1 hypothetical protein N7474_007279 [Penicillium riverlandense]